MTLIRKNSTLIGFEQGVSVKTFDKLFQQTRARFYPLSNPRLSFRRKDNSNASVIIPVTEIPTDPGNGKYNLQIEDSSGQTLKIRVSEKIKATATLTVIDSSSWDNTMSFTLIDHSRTVVFSCDPSLPKDQNKGVRDNSGSYKFTTQGLSSTQAIAKVIFEVINLSYESGELNIKPSYSDGQSLITLEQTVPGHRGNTNITLTNISSKLTASNSNKFVNGTLGIPRTENGSFVEKESRRYHQLDSTAYALYTRGTKSSKQIASDLNKIINNSGFKVKSKIIQDDVLLIFQ